MSWRKKTYLLHRWIGLAVSLQLLAWSTSGLYFTLFDIEAIRGTTSARAEEPAAVDPSQILISPADALEEARQAGIEVAQITRVALETTSSGPRYELLAGATPLAVVDARSGSLRPPLSRAEAESIALHDFVHPATVVSATLLESEPPMEYRSKALPAWQVELEHSQHPNIYVHAITGQVTARRSRIWRIFDFFWMLHIMDYEEREDFGHPLLTGFSVLAVATSLSGLLLWGWRLAPRRKPDRE